jgi:hypothetical protein
MTKARKAGLAAALEAAKESGMTIKTKPAAIIERNMGASIRDVTARITPDHPARLKQGRPLKTEGPRTSRMKGVRLDPEFLAQVERRLARERRTFSGLVQDLLGQWMKASG